MKKLLFILSAITTIQSTAKNKIYYSAGWSECKKKDAYYYRELSKSKDGYNFKDYYIDGIILRSGSLSSLDTEYWKYRNGHFIYYYKDGTKIEEGDYKNSLKDGSWIKYVPKSNIRYIQELWKNGKKIEEAIYDSTGMNILGIDYYEYDKKMHTVTYKDGDSTITKYYYSLYNLIKTETIDSKKTIITENQWNGDKLFSTKTTINNILVYHKEGANITEYSDNGNIFRQGIKRNGAINYYKCYGINGKDTTCPENKVDTNYLKQLGSGPYDKSEYLSKNLHYPEYARIHGISGRVVVSFMVFEDGSIGNLEIKNSIHPTLDEEAFRVISTMEKL